MKAENGTQGRSQVPLRQALAPAYLSLQLVGAVLLGLAWLALRWVQPLLAPGLDAFDRSWAAAFILVPASFAPALMWWHAWVLRRFGNRPRAWRLVAEVAFALQVIVCLVVQGIA